MPGAYSIPEKIDRWGRRSRIDRRMGFPPCPHLKGDPIKTAETVKTGEAEKIKEMALI